MPDDSCAAIRKTPRRCRICALQCLGTGAPENLGEHDNELDKNEKTEIRVQAMQKCDSAFAVCPVLTVTGIKKTSSIRMMALIRQDVDAIAVRRTACFRTPNA
jgi:hypothetical protein